LEKKKNFFFFLDIYLGVEGSAGSLGGGHEVDPLEGAQGHRHSKLEVNKRRKVRKEGRKERKEVNTQLHLQLHLQLSSPPACLPACLPASQPAFPSS